MSFRNDLIILISLLALSACSKNISSTSPCSTSMPTAVDVAIQTALNSRPDTAGIVVAIYHPSLGYMHKAYGLENRVKATQMREDHIFDIGSVMKNFRWVIMHKLALTGSLSLNDEVNDYVSSPVLPLRTLKQLMHHSTGMIDIPDSLFMADATANLTKSYSYNEMINFLTSSSGLGYTSGLTDVFTVGADHQYSSFGPLIASEVAHSVSGREMRLLIEEMILAPLGMGDTSFISYDEKPVLVAQGYDDATTEMNDMVNYENTRSFSTGFGGLMYSSACDLAIYTNNQFNNNKFLPTTTVNAMMTDTISTAGIDIGLGIFKYATWGNFWGHLGSSIHGHSSAIAHRTTDKLSIVVLSNIDEGHDNYATHFDVVTAIGAQL